VALQEDRPFVIAAMHAISVEPDDVGEQHGREHPAGLAWSPVPGDELADLVEEWS
jgi:hypothetical protein